MRGVPANAQNMIVMRLSTQEVGGRFVAAAGQVEPHYAFWGQHPKSICTLRGQIDAAIDTSSSYEKHLLLRNEILQGAGKPGEDTGHS
jgi:hypothetical protein